MLATAALASSAMGNVALTTPRQRFMDYMRVLFTNVAVLNSFLDEIDPAFVVCHKFDLAGDQQQAAQVADFVSPNGVIAGMLAESLVGEYRGHPSVDEPLPFEGADEVAARLQTKLNAFESRYC